MASDGQDIQPSRKRRKVAESCKLCRTKKTRCDGLRPICSPCTAKGTACEYNDATVSVTASSLTDIQERLRRLEQRAIAAPTYAAVSETTNDASTENVDAPHERPFVEHQTTYFIQQITSSAGPTSSTRPLLENNDTWPIAIDAASMVMPPRTMSDDLVRCFETYVYPLFPILHMPSFHEKYSRMWDPRPQIGVQSLAAEVTFHAVLNMVFALGCLNNSIVEHQLKLRTADTFYQRTRKLMPLDALDLPQTETIQCLLLTTVYLTYTRYSYRCSNTLALAIRNTQALRQLMSLDQSSDLINREMFKRLWHQCMFLERLVSQLFGRTPMLAVDDTIPLPAALDDTQPLENENESHTTNVPSVLEAFNISVKIFQVLDEARNMNGEAINKSFGMPELAETLQLNEKLDAIERNLPAHLKPNKSMSEDTPRARMFKLQAESVMLRILNVRSILLRPPVLAAARMSFSSPSATETVSSAETTLRRTVSALSIETAVSAISMLHDNLHSVYRIMSSSVVFMVLSAATLIIAASLVPEFEVSIEPGTKYRDTITMAFEVLEGHQWQIENARGARKQLESFIDIVKQTAKHRIRGASAMPASHDDASLAPNPFEHSEVDLNDPLWNIQWFDTSFWPLAPVP